MAEAHDTATILPPHIEETVRAIATLDAQHQRRAGPVQRVVERSVGFIGRPRFVAMLAIVTGSWIALNAALTLHGHAFDPFPYPTLMDVAQALGLFITVLILIQQRHENDLTQLREQLTLELAILCEQKNAKIIRLLEEMRRDSPHLRNRIDDEAEALSVPADPQAVLEAIMETQDGTAADLVADDLEATEAPLTSRPPEP